ncbi:MAG: ABC transporter substrate-binding protein [Chloroflexi bacterium]|nr:ABC transporter substrate-binding protein [Chloroflexota bacterium]
MARLPFHKEGFGPFRKGNPGRTLCQTIGLLIVAAALVLSGCARPVSTTTATTGAPKAGTTTQAPTPTQKGPYGELKLGLSTFDQDRFEPTKVSTTTAVQFFAPMADWLIRLDGAKLGPGVADSWELAKDGGSWIFRIHKGIKFHNGEDLTADDVKFSLERYMRPDSLRPDIREATARVDKVDDYTVAVYTKRSPEIYYTLLLSFYNPSSLGIVQPKDYIEKNGIDYYEQHPIGSGPFKFSRYTKADFVEYEAVDNHWRKTPAFKKFTEYMVPDESTRSAMIKVGALDMMEAEIDAARQLEDKGFKAVSLSHQQTLVILKGGLDPASKGLPISDVRVRQALSLAINREEIMKFYLFGKGSPPLPALLQGEWVEDADIPYWEQQAAKSYARYDPTEAKRLLAEAGYPQGFSIKVWGPIMGQGAFLPKVAEIVAGYWQAIGVKAEVVVADFNAVRPILDVNKVPNTPLRGNAVMNRLGVRPNPVAMYSTYLSSNASYPLLDLSWPEVDKVLASIAVETNVTKRKEIIAQVIQKVADLYVVLPIAGVPSLGVLGPAADYTSLGPHASFAQYVEYVRHR